MLSFNNDPALKARFLAWLHLTASTGGNSSIEGYPAQIGLPCWLANADKLLRRGAAHERPVSWRRAFVEAIPVGVESSCLDREVLVPLLVAVLRRCLTTFDHRQSPAVRASVENAIQLWRRDEICGPEWQAYRAAAGHEAWLAIDSTPFEWVGNPSRPEQIDRVASFNASWIAAEATKRLDDAEDWQTVRLTDVLRYIDASFLDDLAEELLSLLRGVKAGRTAAT